MSVLVVVCVCLIYKDSAYFPVPLHGGHVNVENALAAVGQRKTVHASPGEAQRMDQSGWQYQGTGIPRIDNYFNFMLPPPESF